MSTRTMQLLTTLLTLYTGTVFAAAPDFKEGEWGVNYRMEMVGMPFPMPPIDVKKTACLDKKNYVPDNAQPGQECKVSDQRVSGNTVTWTMRCRSQERTIEGQGTITYKDKGELYDGDMNAKIISTDNAAPAISFKYVMQGKRLGVCGN